MYILWTHQKSIYINEDWKEKFRQTCLLSDQLDPKLCIEHKRPHIPTSLYKYRSIDELSLENLKNNVVWCANAATMNDPYDSSLSIMNAENSLLETIFTDPNVIQLLKDNPEEQESMSNAAKSTIRKQLETQQTLFNKEVTQRVQICCFSERKDSIVMWSHYSKYHTGFVIEYNFSGLSFDDALTNILWPVIYSEHLFDVSPYLYNKNKLDNFLIVKAAVYKYFDWAYEKEWRLIPPPMISVLDKNLSGFLLPVPSPKAIYLGSKISDENKRKILSIVQEKNIPTYQMKLSGTSFKLESNLIANDL